MPAVGLGTQGPPATPTAPRRNNAAPQQRSTSLLALGPSGPASPLETPRAGFFYPRIIFGGGSELTFTTPANPLISEGAVKGENVSLNGFQETLFVRDEPRLTLGFTILSHDNLIAVRDWWKDWAKLGRQSEVILDHFGTCAGQYEYDLFNTFFNLAHCLYNPFEPKRFVPARQLFTLQLTFRQGRAGN